MIYKTSTLFNAIKDCINSHSVGDEITRQELIIYAFDRVDKFSSATIDNYRRMFSVTEYISFGDGKGKYAFVKRIPENMTVNQLKTQYTLKIQ